MEAIHQQQGIIYFTVLTQKCALVANETATFSFCQGLALLTLSWDKNLDSHSPMNGYPSFYPRIALVAQEANHKNAFFPIQPQELVDRTSEFWIEICWLLSARL